MKFHKISIVFLFLLIMTMGVVCAEDANQTVTDTLQLNDAQEVISDAPEGSYNDLSKNINESSDSITLESDYKYKDTDTIKHIEFTNRNFTIDGNNHVIDADGKTAIFNMTGGNLTLKNLVLKNTNATAIELRNGILNTINVTFINTKSNDVGGAIYAFNSTYYSTNDKFTDNSANDAGSAIFASSSRMHIKNATFTNKNPIRWSLIYGSDSLINVSDTTFANATSRYATAIYNLGIAEITRSKFINLRANATGGAVAVKGDREDGFAQLVIINCEFTNVSAGRNGGAIFADIAADSDTRGKGEVLIVNTTFNKNTAEFGGAILQLGGALGLINSTFTNNTASENGGAVYTSRTNVMINDGTFTNNRARETDGCGGALYLDHAETIIANSTFTDNSAGKGEAIYCYEMMYIINNATFKNNKIYTRFDDDGSSITNCGEEYKDTINDTNITYHIRYNGDPIILNPQPINGNATDPYFNLNNLGLVTRVKDQGSMGSCWAFGAAGAFESAYLIATGIELDISENNIKNLCLPYSEYGQLTNTEAGNMITTAAYFVSWLGAINTTDDLYDELGKVSSIQYGPQTVRTVNAVFINIKDQNAIKEYLTKYGAMNLFLYGANSRDHSYNSTYYSVYNNKYWGNHYVTLVGWNDTFSKDHFSTQAPGDGAWICKNSWGEKWGDGGYFYVSYYDKSLTQNAVGFTFDNVEHYEKLYQNGVIGLHEFEKDYDTYGQVYTSENGDIIAAVGTYFETVGSPYTISVYIDGRMVYSQSGKSSHAGYETVKLNKYIAVDENTTFEIRIKSVNVNYIINDGKKMDLGKYGRFAPIKVYTYHNSMITKNVVNYYDNATETIFTVYNIFEDDTIQVSFNNANYTIQIKNNTGNISLGILPTGEYLVTITYKNQTISTPVLIKTTIFSNDEKSMALAYDASGSFAVQFLDSNGNPLANTSVSAKFDNVALSNAVTNENGILSINIHPYNSIGNHYIDYVNPKNGETLRVTITIFSRFSGNANINMYYYDGHTYKVRVKGDDGKFLEEDEIVTIKIGKHTFKVKTDEDGYAILKIPSKITPGKYTISATYNGQTVKNTLTVKQILKTKKTVKVKKSAKKLVLKATLKNGKTAIKGKVIKFKVKGKTYKAKTNKKGIAKVTIKKSVLKKLKAGKKYKIKVSYLSDVVKATLKVRR